MNCEKINEQIQIITKDKNNYVLYDDYQKLMDQINQQSQHKEIEQISQEERGTEFIEINSKLYESEKEKNYYKQKFFSQSKTLEEELQRVVKLKENYNEINKLYLVTLEEKQKIQNQLSNAIEQRDYAEGELIKKALEFSKHQDWLNEKVEEFQQQQIQFEKERKQFQLQREEYIQQSLKNPNIKRKSTYDFTPQKDEFLEVKLVMKKQQGTMLHPEHGSNKKNYYNIMDCDMDSSQKYLATVGMDKRILITDISKNFQIVCEFQSKYIQNVVCFDDKRGYLITGGQNNEISFYHIKNQKKTSTFKNHQDQINALKVTENNSLISASQDRTIKTWDLKKLRLLGSKMFPSVTLCLDVNSNMIFSGHQDGTLKINSQNTNKNIFQENLFENGYLNFCQYYSNQNKLLLSSRNRQLKIFDLRMMTVLKEFSLQDYDIFDGPKKSFAIDQSFQKLYCGSNSGELKEFDISEKIISLKSTLEITESPTNIPFIINANLHDTLVCFDFEGRITNIRFMSHFG